MKRGGEATRTKIRGNYAFSETIKIHTVFVFFLCQEHLQRTTFPT